MLRFLRNELREGGLDRIRDAYSRLLNNVTVVQIDIRDPASGPTIFDSLNSRQEPMTIGDLVRNGIFSIVASDDPDEVELIDRDHWQPFYKGFEFCGKDYFNSFFFPYGLIVNAALKKTDTYNFLQKRWKGQNPVEIIADLKLYQDPFMDLMCGTNCVEHAFDVAEALRRLFELQMPTSTLPFLMKLSMECKAGVIAAQNIVELLEVIESFLVRRAVCGIEPTGLHAVFKGLWQDLGGKFTSESVRGAISSHRTVTWPSDSDFRSAIEQRALYGASVTRYLLIEYDRSLGGDSPKDVPWIEHVMPQSPDDSWWNTIDREFHKRLVDVLANLIPLSKEMNKDLGNKAYSIKRDRYKRDAMWKSARDFSDRYDTWGVPELLERAAKLSQWGLQRWPHRGAGA